MSALSSPQSKHWPSSPGNKHQLYKFCSARRHILTSSSHQTLADAEEVGSSNTLRLHGRSLTSLGNNVTRTSGTHHITTYQKPTSNTYITWFTFQQGLTRDFLLQMKLHNNCIKYGPNMLQLQLHTTGWGAQRGVLVLILQLVDAEV